MARPVNEPGRPRSQFSNYATVVDWSQWADGQWWELTQGEDFEQTATKAGYAIRSWARRRGLRSHVRVSKDDRVMRVRVYDPS